MRARCAGFGGRTVNGAAVDGGGTAGAAAVVGCFTLKLVDFGLPRDAFFFPPPALPDPPPPLDVDP